LIEIALRQPMLQENSPFNPVVSPEETTLPGHRLEIPFVHTLAFNQPVGVL
jgi:hypothetical protein